jgi:hypothetical protein
VYSGYGGFWLQGSCTPAYHCDGGAAASGGCLGAILVFFGAGGWRLRWVVGGAEVAGGHCWWLVVVVFQI